MNENDIGKLLDGLADSIMPDRDKRPEPATRRPTPRRAAPYTGPPAPSGGARLVPGGHRALWVCDGCGRMACSLPLSAQTYPHITYIGAPCASLTRTCGTYRRTK
jgi:hypothetical protein